MADDKSVQGAAEKILGLLNPKQGQSAPVVKAEPSVEPLTSIAEQSYISLAARAFAYKPTDEQISHVNDALLMS